MTYCDSVQCNNRKICTVYELQKRLQADVTIVISQCRFFSQEKQGVREDTVTRSHNPLEILERSGKIKDATKAQTRNTSSVAKTAASSGMKFSVDEQDL